MTDQRQQLRVEVCGGAAGVHGQQLAALLQPLGDGGPEARQQNLALPQAVDVDRQGLQALREDQLQARRIHEEKTATAAASRT